MCRHQGAPIFFIMSTQGLRTWARLFRPSGWDIGECWPFLIRLIRVDQR
jgi:hypothetical protein